MRELSLHVLDIIENSIEAGASRVNVLIEEDLKKGTMTIEVVDNGRGMTDELVKQVLDPFYTTRKTRHVGLGLPLLAAAARHCEGDLIIESKPAGGTRVRATFRHSHIDRAPLGDMPATLLAVLLTDRPVDLNYTHKVNLSAPRPEGRGLLKVHPEPRFPTPPSKAGLRAVEWVNDGEFQFDSLEVRRELEGIPLTHPKVRAWLFQALREGEGIFSVRKPERELTLPA